MKKRMFAWMLLLAVALLAGCSGAKEENSAATDALKVVLASDYMADEAGATLAGEVEKALPEVKLAVSALATGDTEKDPMGAMAGMTKITAMMASAEIELLICDPDSARRYGDGGESYLAVDKLFTAEELAALQAAPVGVELMDEQGNLTGETSADCGFDLSGCARVVEWTGLANPRAYVLVNAKNVESAKKVIQYLAAE